MEEGSKLSPFSALKTSPLRNLKPPTKKTSSPKLQQKETFSPRVTRSKTGIFKPTKIYNSEFERVWDDEKKKAASKERTRERSSTPKDFQNKKYIRGPKSSVRQSDSQTEKPSTKNLGAMSSFRFQLSSSSKQQSKPPVNTAGNFLTWTGNSKNWTNEGSIFPRSDGATPGASRSGNWTNQESIFPQSKSAVRNAVKSNLPKLNVTEPPHPIANSSSVFNISPPGRNFSFNVHTSKSSAKPLVPEVKFFQSNRPEPQADFEGGRLSKSFELVNDQKEADNVVKDFLKQHGYNSTKRRQSQVKSAADAEMDIDEEPKITIESAQTILQQCLMKVDKIAELRRVMEKNVDLIPDYEWQIKSQRLGIYRAEILETLDPLLSDTAISALKEKLKKKQKKRAWVHKRNNELRSEKQMMKERRARITSFIDEWHEKLNLMEKEGKDKELEKKAAKELLDDVMKRIENTQKYIAIFGRLRELSLARLVADGQDNEVQKQIFQKKMGELQDVWEDILLEYQEEKIALDTIYDRRTSHDLLPPQPKSLEAQWLQVIFGRASLYDENNPFLLAERNFSNFITIRQQWDSYIDPTSKNSNFRIPNFWFLPSRNATSMWRQYRVLKFD